MPSRLEWVPASCTSSRWNMKRSGINHLGKFGTLKDDHMCRSGSPLTSGTCEPPGVVKHVGQSNVCWYINTSSSSNQESHIAQLFKATKLKKRVVLIVITRESRTQVRFPDFRLAKQKKLNTLTRPTNFIQLQSFSCGRLHSPLRLI